MPDEGEEMGMMEGPKNATEKEGYPDDMSGWALTSKFLELKDLSKLHTFEAQIDFLILALQTTGIAALNKFRYKSKSTYWDAARTGTNTNYNKLSDNIYQFGVLGVMGTATLTQLLSMIGIAVPINMMVWEIGVG